jgi:hypothetical protein
MRYLIVFLLVLQGFVAQAQVDEDAEPMLKPRILALDTTLSVANRFNDEIGKAVPGYKLLFTDNSRSKIIKQIYKTDNNETLRLEYKYSTDGGDMEENAGKPVVVYQRISADAETMAGIYNYLFDTKITGAQMATLASTNNEIFYKGRVHQMIIEADDYGPGYWMMTFLP